MLMKVKKVWTYLAQPIRSEKISLFRMFFGAVLLVQTLYFYAIDFIQNDVVDPVLHFPYHGFSFIEVLAPGVMQLFLFLMLLSSIAFIIGYRTRLFSWFYLLPFTYLFLIDKGYYNNHYYLILLLLLLFCFIQSDLRLSISKGSQKVNYRWEEWILLFQFSIVFIYAGLNKINVYWLFNHEPIHHILLAKASLSNSGFWSSAFLEYTMVWGGVLFDVFIVPLLLWKKTRTIGVLLFLFFNGMNTLLFYDIGEIGVFPLLMLSSLVLFYPSTSILTFLNRVFSYKSKSLYNGEKPDLKPLTKVLISAYVVLQILLPLRHHLFKGNVDYTGEGQRFSWRMKSVYKDFKIMFILKDEQKGIEASLDPRTVLTVKQYTNLGYYPELILPVSDNLRQAALEKGVLDPKIYVDYKVAFNGLASQYIVSPNAELSTLYYSPIRHSSWILPLKHD